MESFEAAVRVTEAAISHLTPGHIAGGTGAGAAAELGKKYGELFSNIYIAVVDASAYPGKTWAQQEKQG